MNKDALHTITRLKELEKIIMEAEAEIEKILGSGIASIRENQHQEDEKKTKSKKRYRTRFSKTVSSMVRDALIAGNQNQSTRQIRKTTKNSRVAR